MVRMISTRHIFIASCLASTATAYAVNPFGLMQDIQFRNDNASLRTDSYNHDTQQVDQNVRVFGWLFGTVAGAGNEYYLNDPGFNVPFGAGLPGGSTISFNAVRALRFWNGSGRVSFAGQPPANESLRFFRNSQVSISVNAATPFVPGFTNIALGSQGTDHRHMNVVINGSDGNPIAGDGVEPTPGVYMTFFRFQSSVASITASKPLALLFGVGQSNQNMTRALGYVANPLGGDADYSGSVDISDFAVLVSNFNTADRFFYDGDFNDDSSVDISDFAVLVSNFNTSAPLATVPAGAAVPEPTTIATAALSLVLILRRRGTRVSS
jgi:hypothetical protein